MPRNVICPTCGKSTPDASFCEYCGKPLYSCKACKSIIAKDALFCPDCGQAVTQDGRELKAREHVSWAWWLLPLIPCLMLPLGLAGSAIPSTAGILGIVGGILAWYINRKKDAQKARSMLFLGITVPIFATFIVLGIALTEQDTTPPVITNVQTANVTSTSTIVTWNTDEVADTIVHYGNTTELGLMASNNSLTAQHSIVLDQLAPNTMYFYLVESTDDANNTATDDNAGNFYTFSTASNQSE